MNFLFPLISLLIISAFLFSSFYVFAKFSSFRIENGILKHSFLIFSEFTIPVDKIVSTRTKYEQHSANENMPSYQFLLPIVPYLSITYSNDGKRFVTKFAYTYDPQKLKKYIESQKS